MTTFYKNNNKSGSGRTNGNSGWTGVSQVTIGETPMSSYSQTEKDSMTTYGDAIFQVITREGSEGCDLKTCDTRDNNNAPFSHKHALELSDNEAALFEEIKKHTDHVIILVNSSNVFECGVFQDDPKVSAVLWIGNPGDVGPGAIGRILSGQVNPSGRTVDTWARDFRADPTWQNFSSNSQTNLVEDDQGNEKYVTQDTMFNADGTPVMSWGSDKTYTDHDKPNWVDEENKVVKGGLNGVRPSQYISYEEGIYYDYRYYETKYDDMKEKDEAAADEWYNGEEGVDPPSRIVIFIDELNKYASKETPKNSPILRQVLDVAERGRSLGIVLFAAEQFRSAIHDRVTGNCSTHAYGRTNTIELAKADYKSVPPVYKTMMTRQKQGEYIIQNPVFRSLLNIKFPKPIYKQFK